MLNLTLLQLKVLWEINKKSQCGYNLMKLFNGKKITQGTIYPLLQSMLKDKLITVKKNKKSKFYCLTAKGKEVLKENSRMLCGIYKEIFEKYVCRRCK